MSNKHSDTDSKLPQWLHRLYNAVTNVNLPRPLWLAYVVGKLDDNIEHLRQECHKPNQPNKPGKPAQPDKCGIFTCGSDDQYCYCLCNIRCDICFDTGYDASGQHCDRAAALHRRVFPVPCPLPCFWPCFWPGCALPCSSPPGVEGSSILSLRPLVILPLDDTEQHMTLSGPVG